VSPRARRRKGGTLRDGERRQLALASRHAADPQPPAPPSDRARVLCDGGSRGNPGPAAIAAVLLAPDGTAIEQRAERIGHATAGEAEYRAIRLGLELAAAHGADPIELCSDSRLAIRALERGDPVAREILALAGGFADVRWRWHPRADNRVADALVRELLWD
jgi:ribonuclease HI